MSESWSKLNRRIVQCDRCMRLREHCARVAKEKRAAYADWNYWGKPVPNFGDPAARLLIVGLAPGAHGANRTGRMFTGDRSGDFLFNALHEAGFANQPAATDRDDGLVLRDAAITAAAHCAPPDNRPTTQELANCRPHLIDTLTVMPQVRVIVALGGIGFDATLRAWREMGVDVPRPKPRFAHGAAHEIAGVTLIGCYHPSQQNTFTGRLTLSMLVDIFTDAKRRLGR